MKEKKYLAYDVILSAANIISVIKYKVIDQAVVNDQGQKEFFRNFYYIGYETPDDLSKRILELRDQGFMDMHQFEIKSFDIVPINPLVYLKTILLAKNHSLLEKLYGNTIQDGMCYLESYITYVNLKTGELSIMKVRNHGVYSDQKIHELEDNGYKHICQSFLYHQPDFFEQMRRH